MYFQVKNTLKNNYYHTSIPLSACLDGRCGCFFNEKYVFFIFMRFNVYFKMIVFLKKPYYISHPNTPYFNIKLWKNTERFIFLFIIKCFMFFI
jgi:hypothetical protein